MIFLASAAPRSREAHGVSTCDLASLLLRLILGLVETDRGRLNLFPGGGVEQGFNLEGEKVTREVQQGLNLARLLMGFRV